MAILRLMLRWTFVTLGILGLGCSGFRDRQPDTFTPQDTVEAPCTPYCQRMQANCNPASVAIYPDSQDCYDACVPWPRTGSEGDESGYTLQCHETYAEQTPLDAMLNCPLAGPEREACID